MDTEQIIWTVVIVVAALVLIGLVVAAMRKKSLADKRSRAQELREEAVGGAAGLPDARARAEQAAVQAEHKRHEAERAEHEARAARTEVDQQQARHEDQVRAADRLDPDVNHKAKDYTPDVAQPVGPSNVPTDPAYADPETGRATEATPATGATAAPGADSTTSTSTPVGPAAAAGATGAAAGTTSTTSTSPDTATIATSDPGADPDDTGGVATTEPAGVVSHDAMRTDTVSADSTGTGTGTSAAGGEGEGEGADASTDSDARTDGSHLRVEDATNPTDSSGDAAPDHGGTHRA